MRVLAALLVASFLCGVAAGYSTAENSAASITGHWEGDLIQRGARLPVSFDFSTGPMVAGTFTSLTQRVMEYPLDTVAVTGRTVQGGLIAPLAASRAPDAVAFLVAAATFPDSVWQQDIYRVGLSIRKQNFNEGEIARAMGVYRLFVDVARGVRRWDELEAASTPVRNERWYKWLGIPPREHWLWAYYRGTGNFQALAAWERIRVPVLLVYGERDQLVPVGESIRKIEGALHQAGNQTYAAIIIPRAAHNLTVTPEPGAPFDWWRAAPGVTSLLTAWVVHQTRAVRSEE